MPTFARIAVGSFILPTLGAVGLVSLEACTRTLLLGTDCPDQAHECAQDRVTEPEPDPSEPLDAGREPTEDDGGPREPEDAGGTGRDVISITPDAEQGGDAASDANLDAIVGVSALELANGEFERNGGLGGDLVLAKLIGTLLPIPPIPLLFAEVPSWYACWATTVHSVSREPVLDAGIDTNDYLMFVVNGTPVRQQLLQPLSAGGKYALELALQARPDPAERLVLEIRGANEECAVGDLLATTRELPGDATWARECVEFVASREYKYLLIAPNALNTTRPSGLSRLALDDLRSVAGCGTPDSGAVR